MTTVVSSPPSLIAWHATKKTVRANTFLNKITRAKMLYKKGKSEHVLKRGRTIYTNRKKKRNLFIIFCQANKLRIHDCGSF